MKTEATTLRFIRDKLCRALHPIHYGRGLRPCGSGLIAGINARTLVIEVLTPPLYNPIGLDRFIQLGGQPFYCLAGAAVDMKMLRTEFLRTLKPFARSIADAIAAGIADTKRPYPNWNNLGETEGGKKSARARSSLLLKIDFISNLFSLLLKILIFYLKEKIIRL